MFALLAYFIGLARRRVHLAYRTFIEEPNHNPYTINTDDKIEIRCTCGYVFFMWWRLP